MKTETRENPKRPGEYTGTSTRYIDGGFMTAWIDSRCGEGAHRLAKWELQNCVKAGRVLRGNQVFPVPCEAGKVSA